MMANRFAGSRVHSGTFVPERAFHKETNLEAAMGRYTGKTALITGGTSGIGLAAAKAFLGEGARVVVTGRDQKALQAARHELGAGALVLRSDTSKLSDIEALAAEVKERLGGIEVLFVNAGIARFAPLEASTEAFWDETFAINVKGAYFTVQRLSPLLKAGGAIVLNTSVVDEKGFPGASVYSASKAALRSLARTLATEFLARGIRVNAVSPGPIATPILAKGGMVKEQVDAFTAQMREGNPMKRLGTSDEVARAVLFLASTEASFTTGAELVVDGGLTQL
jgi:NAD(P)-dependent dehydrogenase (short-subunit alcohol dehydrogenase family)